MAGKETVRRVLRGAGLELDLHRHVRYHLPHLYLAELFKQFEITCVLDVGANVGGYRDWLRERVGYEGLIVSFEPVAAHYEVIRDRSQGDAFWQVYHMALGSTNGSLPINVMTDGVFSSFLTPDHSSVNEFRGQNEIERQEVVDVRTLDSIISRLPESIVLERTYLKLDTQGFDMEVVAGAERTLRDIPALQTEVSMRQIYQGMPSFFDTHQIMAAKGFDVGGLFHVTNDELLRAIEFDCVMINSARAKTV